MRRFADHTLTVVLAVLLAGLIWALVTFFTSMPDAEAHARCDYRDHDHLVFRNWALRSEHWRYLRDDVRWDYRLHRWIVWSIWSVDGRTVSESRCS
jgi:hypothetical protein